MQLLKVSLDMEVSLLFRKAEQRNNIDLYFSCMHLSLPILAVSNAKNYVHIFTELLKYWKTCSKCEKNLIAQYGFVLETSNGVFVGIDYGHEKYVRLVRDTTGKIYHARSVARIEHTAMCRMYQQEKQGIKDRKAFKGHNLMRYDGRVLAHVMGVLDSIGAWCEQPNSKPREQDKESVYSLEKIGERLPTEILHSNSIGTDLVAAYAKKFACSHERVIKREGTGLRKK
jgi:hypothetical protein